VTFELGHGISNVISDGLDVVRCRSAHIRMSEDSLNHHVRHAKAIQIASESTPRRVPSVPLSDASITLVVMIFLVIRLIRHTLLMAVCETVLHRKSLQVRPQKSVEHNWRTCSGLRDAGVCQSGNRVTEDLAEGEIENGNFLPHFMFREPTRMVDAKSR
jgi:hypothetical protein